MNKQNLFAIVNIRKKPLFDKTEKRSKSTENAHIRSYKTPQNAKNHINESNPSKKDNEQPFYVDSKSKLHNFEKMNIKRCIKTSMKLRIVCGAENDNKGKSNLNNSLKEQDFLAKLSGLLEVNLIHQLLQNELIYKTRLNQILIKPQVFSSLLKKILITVFDRYQVLPSQQFGCLNSVLSKLRSLISLMVVQVKKCNNNFYKTFQISNANSRYNYDVKVAQTELQNLHRQKFVLIQQVKILNSEKNTIVSYNQEKKKEIQANKFLINENMRKIEDLKQNQLDLIQSIQKFQTVFSKCQQQYDKIINYAETQTKNKHIQLASVAYKNIESQIYQYAVYLQANQLASSQTYQSIRFKNQCFVINNLENSLKEINKEIIHNDILSLNEKLNLMRDFVLKTNEQHKKKDQEYQQLLDFKTKCIRKFVNMMKLWLDNWTFKQEYLKNLRKQFAINSKQFQEEINHIFHKKICKVCEQSTKQYYRIFLDHYRNIQENYKLGNSFY